jgi:hypothetical protein
VPTWLVGITLGVAVRMVILSHYRWNELAFLAVALVFNGLVAGLIYAVQVPGTFGTWYRSAR